MKHTGDESTHHTRTNTKLNELKYELVHYRYTIVYFHRTAAYLLSFTMPVSA